MRVRRDTTNKPKSGKNMRYDIEDSVTKIFADYLSVAASTAVGQVCDPNRCPIVTFFDPMSVDDADRIVVRCPDAVTDPADMGRFSAEIEVGIKTLWTQVNIKKKFSEHHQRVNDIRDKLMAPSIIALLATVTPAGVALDFVHPRKHFKTHVAESTQAKWIYSETSFSINGYFTGQ